jgi:hypothetical protein
VVEIDEEADSEVEVDEKPIPATYRANRDPGPGRASPGPSPKVVNFTLRILLRYVAPLLLLAFSGGLIEAGMKPVAFVMLASAFVLFRFSDFLARRLTAAFAPTYSCPSCHSVFEAVDRWNCGCGYHDHKDRHFIIFRCPMCGLRAGRTNCKRCKATIFLQR